MPYSIRYEVKVDLSCICDGCGLKAKDDVEIVDYDQPDCNPVIMEEWAQTALEEQGWMIDPEEGEDGKALCPDCAEKEME